MLCCFRAFPKYKPQKVGSKFPFHLPLAFLDCSSSFLLGHSLGLPGGELYAVGACRLGWDFNLWYFCTFGVLPSCREGHQLCLLRGTRNAVIVNAVGSSHETAVFFGCLSDPQEQSNKVLPLGAAGSSRGMCWHLPSLWQFTLFVKQPVCSMMTIENGSLQQCCMRILEPT